jgi:hypothetical protein
MQWKLKLGNSFCVRKGRARFWSSFMIFSHCTPGGDTWFRDFAEIITDFADLIADAALFLADPAADAALFLADFAADAALFLADFADFAVLCASSQRPLR